MSIIKIGSRKSQLAIKQTEAVIKKLKEHFPNDTFEIVGISTKGDRQLDKSLQSFGGKGVFIKEIETALLSGEIDMAVHSAKDMPTDDCRQYSSPRIMVKTRFVTFGSLGAGLK